jgi:hypothetical protein
MFSPEDDSSGVETYCSFNVLFVKLYIVHLFGYCIVKNCFNNVC